MKRISLMRLGSHPRFAGAIVCAIAVSFLSLCMPSGFAVETAGSSCALEYRTILYESGQASLTCLKDPSAPHALLWQLDSNPDHWKFIPLTGTDSLGFGRECLLSDLNIAHFDIYGREFTCQLVSGRTVQIWYSKTYFDEIQASLPVLNAPTPKPNVTKTKNLLLWLPHKYRQQLSRLPHL